VVPAGTVITGPGPAPPDGWIDLSVEDRGTGIPTPLLARVFEPYFTTKAPLAGSGIGLATVREIVVGAAGALVVDTSPRGTTVHVLLPRVPDPGEVRPAPERAPDAAAAGAGETVLLVDDDRPVRMLSREVLRAQGYRVLEASNGLAALRVAAAQTGPVHALVADVVLPGLRGPQLADWLRIERPQLAVLLLTGSEPEPPPDARPGDVLLAKPFEPGELLANLRAALDRSAGRTIAG
jgi:CheY-like chemotaxis protein